MNVIAFRFHKPLIFFTALNNKLYIQTIVTLASKVVYNFLKTLIIHVSYYHLLGLSKNGFSSLYLDQDISLFNSTKRLIMKDQCYLQA